MPEKQYQSLLSDKLVPHHEEDDSWLDAWVWPQLSPQLLPSYSAYPYASDSESMSHTPEEMNLGLALPYIPKQPQLIDTPGFPWDHHEMVIDDTEDFLGPSLPISTSPNFPTAGSCWPNLSEPPFGVDTNSLLQPAMPLQLPPTIANTCVELPSANERDWSALMRPTWPSRKAPLGNSKLARTSDNPETRSGEPSPRRPRQAQRSLSDPTMAHHTPLESSDNDLGLTGVSIEPDTPVTRAYLTRHSHSQSFPAFTTESIDDVPRNLDDADAAVLRMKDIRRKEQNKAAQRRYRTKIRASQYDQYHDRSIEMAKTIAKHEEVIQRQERRIALMEKRLCIINP